MKHLYITLLALLFSFLSPKAFGQVVGPILGTPVICQGLTTSLSDTTAGGVWVSSMSSVATVGTNGMVTGGMVGTTTISYTVGGTTVTQVVTINPDPTPILGALTVCVGLTTVLTDGITGGTWSDCASGAVIFGSSTGIAEGVAAGTCVITYTLPTGCIATTIVTVNALPTASLVTPSMCVGTCDSVIDAPGGGSWSVSNPAIATASPATVCGLSGGTTYVTYTVATGCAATFIATVNPAPPGISGTPAVCVGSTTLLTDVVAGGVWSCSNIVITTVNPTTGTVYAVSVGTATISYSLATSCYATMVVTVDNPPSPITGLSTLCVGGTDTLTGSPAGGTWSSSTPSIASITGGLLSGGVVEGISPGIAIITYSTGAGCTTTFSVTVSTTVSMVTGVSMECVGSTIALSDATAGGSWSSGSTTVATADASTGIVTGMAAGTALITYSLPAGCLADYEVTVLALPPGILGAAGVCVGGTTILSDTEAGGTWSSSSGGATVVSITGVVTGVSAGTVTITYTNNVGCATTIPFTVYAAPTITASATNNCGGTYSLSGSGAGTGGSYTWAAAAGLSCTACATSVATVAVGITYTVTGTDINSCTNTGTVTVNGNRISGYITLTAAPTDTLRVWAIQFDPTDSALIAQDSTLTCMDSGTPYYEFDGLAAGSYLVKAKLLSSVPGTSGYIPTYGLSTSAWDSAAPVTHVSATDTQHINMLYGTVPTGPGFIGGLISSGAGRGTSGGAPAVGMLVYLKDAANNILTFTYTDGTGAYSFSNLANDTYVVYPVDYHYQTTAWIGITLSPANETSSQVSFYEHTSNGTITPYTELCCGPLLTIFDVFPNPAADELNIQWANERTGNADMAITDMAGREVYKGVLNMLAATGSQHIAIPGLSNGVYFLSIKSSSVSYTHKLVIER